MPERGSRLVLPLGTHACPVVYEHGCGLVLPLGLAKEEEGALRLYVSLISLA
jgi:hypothetical protein